MPRPNRSSSRTKDLADRFGNLDPRNYSSKGPGLTGTVREIVHRLRRLRAVRDLDEMKALARDKAELAGRHARVRADADRLYSDGDLLRFRLLLEPDDFPAISTKMQEALLPFFVLKSSDWTNLEHVLGMLDRPQRDRLKDEVNELMFLWVASLDESLSRLEVDPDDRDRDAQRRRALTWAVEICDHALNFAEPKGPWFALRARLSRSRSVEPGSPPAEGGTLGFRGEPRDIESETSALAAFQWGLLELLGRAEGEVHRLDASYRAPAGRRLLVSVLPGIRRGPIRAPDEALEHYSIAAALRPDSPWVRSNRAHIYRMKGEWRRALGRL